ncbi:MAG TPA: Gfo/Idh/MocA family oxidoreductase [Candidatus Acidoferrales bacterium]|nr:Gfo/Idh/MocA family oxidoreductase [Candidatus Acidoferrales bacterium]
MPPRKIRWGVLGVASIAVRRVIPAMQKCEWGEIAAIASRDDRKAEEAARTLGIAKPYGSYDALLADPEIDAIYIPLPNHLHVAWSIRAAEAGKHVLCEKPLGINAAEVRRLIEARDRAGVKIGEAFMVRTHPRWLRVLELIRSGRIGELRLIHGFFGYFNRNLQDVRNIAEFGGGALLDIGCYGVTLSRFLFGEEPSRAMGLLERDREMKTDRLASTMFEFPSGQSTFSCTTQLAYHQRMILFGTKGRIEIDRPINPPIDQPSRIVIDDNPSDPTGSGIASETIDICNQFTIQGDLFARAILEGAEVPVPLEDSLRNMSAIDAIFRSAESGKWEKP